jgi:hypothetical protein
MSEAEDDIDGPRQSRVSWALREERDDLARAAARRAYRALKADLAETDPFALHIDLAGMTGLSATLVPLRGTLAGRPLTVPLGHIAWHAKPEILPALGILVRELPARALCDGFRALFRSFADQPFARLLFLCQDLRTVPLLGRYGFACEHVGSGGLDRSLPRIRQKFAVKEFRDLTGAATVLPGAHQT